MKLRPYQRRAVVEIERRLSESRRVVAVGPTGMGKTVVGVDVARRMRGRVLWLAHRIELLRQARDQLLAAGMPARSVGILSGPDKVNLGASVLVASVDTLRARESIPSADLIVVDEAHRVAADGYRAILAKSASARVLGLTATPWRLDGKPLADTFADLYVMAEAMKELIKAFLSRRFDGPRDARMELRLYSAQRAAYDEAARIEGDDDASAWARRHLDAAARRALKRA